MCGENVKQTVRIIGGKYRGKKLHFPDISGLRPTPDRVKETLFNWLMNSIHGSRCLDAFAGSGSLGFEAFSRGAERVVLLDESPMVFSNLNQIALSFETDKLSIIHTKAQSYLHTTQESFDIIFLDPPFSSPILPDCIAQLSTSQVLEQGGFLYIESAELQELEPGSWQKIKCKQAGQVFYHLYQKI